MNDFGHVETNSPKIGHSILAVDRKEITVRGVREVLSFDENNVRLVTEMGVLNLEGSDLRIHVLNVRDGIVAVTGMLVGVLYEDQGTEQEPALPVGRREKVRRGRRFS